MQIQKCRADYTVESYMVDFRNKLKLSMLLNLEQETAFQHAGQIFPRYGDPSADGGFWVAVQTWTTIARLPEVNEHIEVETWIRSATRVISRRNFRVTDAKGHLVALTSMDWAVLDQTTRKPRRLEFWNKDLDFICDEQANPMEGQRLRQPPELALAYQKTVRCSDIDVNNHANNTRYTDWILDCFGLEYLTKKEIAHINLCFKKECVMDDRLNIFLGKHGNHEYYLEGRFTDSQTLAFQAEVTFHCFQQTQE